MAAQILVLMAFGPILVGLLMFAASYIARRFSVRRVYMAVLFLLAAGIAMHFVPQLFGPDLSVWPSLSGPETGWGWGIPGLPVLVPQLMPVFVSAGAMLLAAAALLPFLRVAAMGMVPARGSAPPTESGGSAVEHGNGEGPPEG